MRRAERQSSRPLAYGALLVTVVAVAFGVRAIVSGETGLSPQAVSPAAAPGSQAQVAAPGATPARLLKAGKRGAAVADLQVALGVLGHFPALADGSFGAATASAVSSFQGSQGLAADGVAGPVTRNALVAALAGEVEEDAGAAWAGLETAVATGSLDAETAEGARAVLDDAVAAVGGLSPGKAAVLALVLEDVAEATPTSATRRVQSLAGLLEQNVAGLVSEPLAVASTGLVDGSGGVYRFFPAHGYQFHPLASFAQLNKLARRGEKAKVERLADALVARGKREGRTTTWEYDFPFGGPAPWTSGLAQAAGAQAFARAGTLLADRALLEEGGRAFRAIPPRLSLTLGGAWIREYSFSDMAVLNAHLQSIVSLSEYVELTGDEQARVFVAEMSEAAQALVHEFDTGCWSLYSHGGAPATPAYHDYHIQLAKRLAALTEDGVWHETAARWTDYRSAGGC